MSIHLLSWHHLVQYIPFVLARTSLDLWIKSLWKHSVENTTDIQSFGSCHHQNGGRGISFLNWMFKWHRAMFQIFHFISDIRIWMCLCYEYVMNSIWFSLTIWYPRRWISQLSKQTSMSNLDDSCTIIWDLWFRETNLTMINFLPFFYKNRMLWIERLCTNQQTNRNVPSPNPHLITHIGISILFYIPEIQVPGWGRRHKTPLTYLQNHCILVETLWEDCSSLSFIVWTEILFLVFEQWRTHQ